MHPKYLGLCFEGSTVLQPVATPVSEVEWNMEREHAHRAFKAGVDAIARAPAHGQRASSVVRKFLYDPKVRLSAALRALGGLATREEALSLQDRLNPWADSFPPVFWYPKKKASGGFRPICIPPPELKAVHYMLAAAISAQLLDCPALYGIPGKSVADAARELKALQNAGFVYLAKTDVKNCFQSIDPDTLYQLPLPLEVKRRALDHRNLNFTEEGHPHASQALADTPYPLHGSPHKASGPSGLLQGSPASSIIFAWLMKGIPSNDDQRVMLCFDNIVVAARTPEGSRAMINTLTAYFRQSPAGPLALCEPTFADNEPLEFLGGLFDPERTDIGLADGTLRRLEKRLAEAEEADQALMHHLRGEHSKRAARSTLYRHYNPLEGQYPTEIWHMLRDFRAGVPFVEADSIELLNFLETTGLNIDLRNDPPTADLHRNLFAGSETPSAKVIRHVLRAHPRKSKAKSR